LSGARPKQQYSDELDSRARDRPDRFAEHSDSCVSRLAHSLSVIAATLNVRVCKNADFQAVSGWSGSCVAANFGVMIMKPSPRTRLIPTAPAALGFILASFAFAACGGSAFDGGNGGDASAGGSAAMGGQSNGGAVGLGGNSGVGGSAGSPSTTGGAPSICSHDSDCVACAYTKAPENSTQCYCAICATTPMSKAQCEANQATWQQNCTGVPMACPAIACVMSPTVVCLNGVCAVSSTTPTN
jgi:hypothetical protein